MMDSRSRYYNSPKYAEAREASKQRAMDRIADRDNMTTFDAGTGRTKESMMPSYSFTLFAVEINKRLEERGLSLYKVSTHVGQHNLINQLQRLWKESRSIDDTIEAILGQIEENS